MMRSTFIMPLAAIVLLLQAIALAEVERSEMSSGAPDFSTVETSSSPHYKLRHKARRTKHDSVAIQRSVAEAGGTLPRVGAPDVKRTSAGPTDFQNGNDAGKLNTGSQDHTPGTTETSGL